MAVCPIMSYAQSRVECGEAACALWDPQVEACGHKAVGLRVSDAIEQLVRTLNDLKNKI